MSEKVKKRPGPGSLFRGKRRAPVSLTLTPDHHKKVETAKRRLDVSRSDLIGLLIESYADTVVKPRKEQPYQRLRNAVAALGGTLEENKFSGPQGKTWVLELGGKRLSVRSDSKAFRLLDACSSKPSSAASRAPDGDDNIDPRGLADLFKELAAS